MSTHTQTDALSWAPDPSLRSLEIALAVLLAFCALVLHGSRWPAFPSLPRPSRADPASPAWTAVRLRRPNVPEAVWVLLAGVAAAVFIGGAAAFPAGVIGAVGTYFWLSRQRAKAELRERTRLTAQVPPLADLFAAGLSAGLQPAQAAVTVAQAFGGIPRRPRSSTSDRLDRSKLTGINLLAYRFHDAATAVLAGADPQAAWSALAMDEATAPLATAIIRAERTGAPAATIVGRAARQLRDAAADALSAEVRTVGVRATAPLTLCFLPAFICLGVVPTALGLLPRLRG
jgi:hypothetical protein